MLESATYVYCLVERGSRPVLRHVPRGLPFATAPELIDLGRRLWAVAATVPLDEYGSEPLERRLTDINWVADIALAHEGVVEYFASRAGATVVPMKLFTMFANRERAAAALSGRRREITPVLARIRGCREWGVRVTRRAAAPAPPSAAARSSGTAFLAAKKRARDDVRERAIRAADAAEAVVATLSRLARAAVLREPPENAAAPPLVDAAFLVASANTARFRAAAGKSARACRAAGADLILTGPWPAYNFVQQMPETA